MSYSVESITTSTAFYQKHLDQVSRSFAFCIKELREPFKNRVAISYLLCRMLDTLEDSAFENIDLKFEQIEMFENFILARPQETEVALWQESNPTSALADELLLLKDTFHIVSELHSLPEKQKQIIQNTVLKMAEGMKLFLKKAEKQNPVEGENSELVLNSLAEVNEYCFYVAGIVGEMLTRLMATVDSAFVASEARIFKAHQFGLFLQKINLLKDQIKDEKLGRRLVPSREELWKSLDSDAEGAVQYLLDIPVEEKEFRLFCGWSLFLGMASLRWISISWTTKIFEKIPHGLTEKLLGQVTTIITDNAALIELFSKMKQNAGIETGFSPEPPQTISFIIQNFPAEV